MNLQSALERNNIHYVFIMATHGGGAGFSFHKEVKLLIQIPLNYLTELFVKCSYAGMS